MRNFVSARCTASDRKNRAEMNTPQDQFRTPMERINLEHKIDYKSHILALGSCFTEHISKELEERKFHIATLPSGILFNPMSIASHLYMYATNRHFGEDALLHDKDHWFCYSFHSDFSGRTADECLERINEAVARGSQALEEADTLLLTWGTAWVYRRAGREVANCHKQPASEFERVRQSVEWIVKGYSQLIEKVVPEKNIILTISPVRHLGDGLVENSLSKATLRLAAAELAEKFAKVEYFPAYELLMDDLRDYRFYADDMVHPSTRAIKYVWQHFADAVLSPETQKRVRMVEKVMDIVHHRPRDPQSKSHLTLVRHTLKEMDRLPEVDFQRERAAFLKCLEII